MTCEESRLIRFLLHTWLLSSRHSHFPECSHLAVGGADSPVPSSDAMCCHHFLKTSSYHMRDGKKGDARQRQRQDGCLIRRIFNPIIFSMQLVSSSSPELLCSATFHHDPHPPTPTSQPPSSLHDHPPLLSSSNPSAPVRTAEAAAVRSVMDTLSSGGH